MDEPFEVIGAPGRVLVLDGGERSPAADLAMSLLTSRLDGPRLLDQSEWSDLLSLGADGSIPWPDSMRMLHRFATAREDAPVVDGRHRIVVDVRALQSDVVNGTVTHARNVIDAVLDALPDGSGAEAFVDPHRRLPDRAVMSRFTGVFDPATIDGVAVFVEPSPFESKVEAFDLDVRPGITRIGVWLDGIIGSHPEHFLAASPQVFGYQYSIECVGVLDHVLALSRTSRDEAIAAGIDASRIRITGCRSSFEGIEPSDEPRPFDRFILISATTTPHKDLVTAFIGLLPSLVTDETLGVVMLASLSDAQRAAVDGVLDEVGIHRERVTSESQVSTPRMVQLFGAAELVVVPSQHEGFSLPVVEAIGLGTPVVLSGIGAHRELLGDGEWMFAPGDPVGCSRAIRAIRRDVAGSIRRERSALELRHDPDRLARVVGEVVSSVCAGSE